MLCQPETLEKTKNIFIHKRLSRFSNQIDLLTDFDATLLYLLMFPVTEDSFPMWQLETKRKENLINVLLTVMDPIEMAIATQPLITTLNQQA